MTCQGSLGWLMTCQNANPCLSRGTGRPGLLPSTPTASQRSQLQVCAFSIKQWASRGTSRSETQSGLNPSSLRALTQPRAETTPHCSLPSTWPRAALLHPWCKFFQIRNSSWYQDVRLKGRHNKHGKYLKFLRRGVAGSV